MIIDAYKFSAPASEIIITNRVFDFDADLGITTDGDGVTNWADQDSNVGDLFAESAARSPALLINGNPSGDGDAIDFDGSGNRMRVTAGFTWPDPVTLYLVMRMNTWSINEHFWDGHTTNSMGVFLFTATPKFALYSGAFTDDNSDLAVGTWGIVCVVYNGSGSSIRVDNNTKTTGDPQAANPGGLSIGADPAGGGAADMTVVRILGYNTSAHSDAEQSQNITALNNIYSVF